MSRVAAAPFTARQKASPSIPGIWMSSTMTSGRCLSIAAGRLRRTRGLVELHVDRFERRAEQCPKTRVVVHKQDAHRFSPPTHL